MSAKSPGNGSKGAGQAAGSKAVEREPGSSSSTTGSPNHEPPVQASSPAELPVDSLREAAPFLRRPFMPEAIRFKVQSTVGAKANPRGGVVVAYIDARLVVERLNAVCPHLWHDEYQPLDAKHLLCRLTVDGVTRQDVGEAAGMSKDLYSDALKRAAVKFGVGVSVYALPQVFLPVGEKGLELVGSEQKKSLRISDGTLARLRGGYATWLGNDGAKFGAPLDHGDTLEPLAGEAVEDTEPVEDAPGPVEGKEAESLRAEVKQAYDALREVDATAMTPAEYGRRRQEADLSIDGLRELLALLTAKLDEGKVAA